MPPNLAEKPSSGDASASSRATHSTPQVSRVSAPSLVGDAEGSRRALNDNV